MRHLYTHCESEQKSVERTLQNFVERSNDAFVNSNEYLQNFSSVYDNDYRLCLTALCIIVESMGTYKDRTKLVDVKTQIMCMRIMARWFACLGVAERQGNLIENYGDIFEDAKRCRRQRSRTYKTRLCMSDYTKYMIAGTCLIVAIKYQSDESEVTFLESEHVEYFEFISSRVLDKVNVYNALIFYRQKIRRIVGLPDLPSRTVADGDRAPSFSISQTRFIVEQRKSAQRIESCVLSDLEWRISEPVEIDFVELYALLAASIAHEISSSEKMGQLVFQRVLVLGQCIAIMMKIDSDLYCDESVKEKSRRNLDPCWITALSIVMCVIEISIGDVTMRNKIIASMKQKYRSMSSDAMDQRAETIRTRLSARYKHVFKTDEICKDHRKATTIRGGPRRQMKILHAGPQKKIYNLVTHSILK